MPRHNFAPLAGELRRLTLDAPSLRDNRLGDPSRREIVLYASEGCAPDGHNAPLLVGLAAYGGSGLKLVGWQSFSETLLQRVDRLVACGEMGPVVVALPDAFTSLGGNQYLDSPWLGRWSSYLGEDLLPAIATELGHVHPAARRGVFGHSSGGYGALMQALQHPGRWGAVACHSGDMGFDWLYRHELAGANRALAAHGHDPELFLRTLADRPRLAGPDFITLMMIAMAASYDGDSERITLPVDPHTCELDEAAWARWLACDPVELAREPAKLRALEGLQLLYLDCGSRDEYNLHFGARRFTRALESADIEHVYEEFDGGHSKVAYRYDRSLPLLQRALSGGVSG